jgi:uncharacterized protein (TIGR00369 family)
MAQGTVAIGRALEYAHCDEVGEALVEHIARNPQALLELIEARHSEKGVAHDQHRPPLPHHLQALSHGTVHVREALAFHPLQRSELHHRMQSSTVSFVTEPAPMQQATDLVLGRRREVTWQDPLVGAALALEMSGLDYLRAVADGTIARPPVAALLGMGIERIEPGRVTFGLDVGEHLYNPIGSVHGGIFATLLDSAMGCAVHSTLAAGQAYTTLELKVNLVKALTVDTPKVTAEGEVISAGRRVATASSRLIGPDGTLFAHATTTCLVFDAAAAPRRPAAHAS